MILKVIVPDENKNIRIFSYKENEKYPRNALNVRTYDGWELTDWITIDMTKELTSYWHKNPGYEK